MPKSVSSETSRATEATDATDATDATEASDLAENQPNRQRSRRRSKKRNGEVEEDRGGQKIADENAETDTLGPLHKQDIIQLNKILPQIDEAKAKAKTKSSPSHKHGPVKSYQHHHHHHQPPSPKGKSKKSRISGRSRASGTSKYSLANQPINETAPKLPILALLVPPQAVLPPPAPPATQPIAKPVPLHPDTKGHIPDVKMYIYDKYAAKYTVKQLEMVLSKSYYTGHLIAITFWALFLCTGIVIDYLQYDTFLLKESTYHIISSYDVGLVSSARNSKFGWSILLILLLLMGCLISYFALSRSYLVVGLVCISVVSLQAFTIVLAVVKDYKPSFEVQVADSVPGVHRINLALMIVISGCWIIWQSIHYLLAIMAIRGLHNPADYFYHSSGGV